MTSACDAFVQSIESHYAYLFSEFGFRIIHRDERANGRYCLVVLESDSVRVKMELEPGVPLAFVGRRDTPVCWSVDESSKAEKPWFTLSQVLAFMEDRPRVGLPIIQSAAEPRPTVDQLMADRAARLRPHAQEMFSAFGPEQPKDWWRAFDAFRARRLRETREEWHARGGREPRSRATRIADAIRSGLLGR